MELKDRKFINNTGKLPEFAGGSLPQSAYVGIWNNAALQRVGLLGGATLQANRIPAISSPSNPKHITPSNLSTPRVYQTGPSTRNGITTNAGTGSLTGGNTGPSQADSSASAIHPGFAIGAWLGGGVLEGLGLIKSADEHLAEAGTSTANINGISYIQQNTVDAGKIMSDYNKSTATDFLTNPARAITKLFGRSEARREAENAARYANIQQSASRDTAYADYLRLNGAKKYGDMEDQALYAANGKLPKLVDGKPTYSVEGATNLKPNSKLSGGEIAYNKEEGIASEVGGPVNNKDLQYGFLRASDGVLSNKPGMFGYSPADMFRATGDIQSAEDYMIASNMAKGRRMYKCGKLPKHAEGWLGNFIPSALGTLASIDQMYLAYKNKPYRPNTYASNPYEIEALSTLAGLRVNPYPIISQLRDAEYRSNRAIDMAGGLSGSQRTATRLANLNTTQKNISNLLSSIQLQNNAYKSSYAQAALTAGQLNRTARMQANQWDLDMYSKAHAARNKGIQTGIANALSQIQQYQANEFKRRQSNDTMDLYRADLRQRLQYMNWMLNLATRGIGLNPTYNDPTDPVYGNDEYALLYLKSAKAYRKRLGIW